MSKQSGLSAALSIAFASGPHFCWRGAADSRLTLGAMPLPVPRPWPFRWLPARWRGPIYNRVWRTRRAEAHFAPLFAAAPLHFAPAAAMRLSPADYAHGSIAFTGYYEWEWSRRIAAHAREESGLLVDAGANYGYYSLLWAAARPDNRALALEASPRNFPALVGNVAHNGFADRVDCRAVALADAAGERSLDFLSDEETGWATLAPPGRARGDATVLAASLDDLLPPGVHVTVLKLDIEGAESLALRGARRLLAERRVRHVYFEQYPPVMQRLGVEPGEATRHLAAAGYAVSALDRNGWDLYATLSR